MNDNPVVAILNLMATALSPLLAVQATRWLDNKAKDEGRRMDVFRDLMRTRGGLKISVDHVAALNLVEIEFSKDAAVIAAWRSYHKSLSKPQPKDMTIEELRAQRREWDTLLVKLLHAMAQNLKFKIEQMDILDGGYIPQAWEILDVQHSQIRDLTLQVLQGNRAIPFTASPNPSPGGPYPPAPTASDFRGPQVPAITNKQVEVIKPPVVATGGAGAVPSSK